jgi:hypothetical protein
MINLLNQLDRPTKLVRKKMAIKELALSFQIHFDNHENVK